MLSESEFKRIVFFVKSHYGIDLSQKQVLVNGRLETYFQRKGYSDFEEFMAKAEEAPRGTEAEELINVLTTNHTYFMREPIHFQYMQKVVLPYLKRKEAGEKDLRIWSAAASTGEEPYTLVMVLMDYFGLEHGEWDTKVLATDVSTRVLEQAAAGIYYREQIEPLPERWKRRFFEIHSGGECRVREELKREVIFRRFNLMDPFPFKRKMHIVLLRNVMIYFDQPTKRQLIRKVYDIMEPGGYLFIGRTETIDRTSSPFQLIQPAIFRKQGKAGD